MISLDRVTAENKSQLSLCSWILLNCTAQLQCILITNSATLIKRRFAKKVNEAEGRRLLPAVIIIVKTSQITNFLVIVKLSALSMWTWHKLWIMTWIMDYCYGESNSSKPVLRSQSSRSSTCWTHAWCPASRRIFLRCQSICSSCSLCDADGCGAASTHFWFAFPDSLHRVSSTKARIRERRSVHILTKSRSLRFRVESKCEKLCFLRMIAP